MIYMELRLLILYAADTLLYSTPYLMGSSKLVSMGTWYHHGVLFYLIDSV